MEQFTDYLESFGLDETIINRIKDFCGFYNYVGIDIEEIFVSEYIESDGNRIFENLWFINESSIMEMHNFLNEEDFDFEGLRNIQYWSIQKSNYDNLENPSSDSRMVLTFITGSQRTGRMKASKENCGKLFEIFGDEDKGNNCKSKSIAFGFGI